MADCRVYQISTKKMTITLLFYQEVHRECCESNAAPFLCTRSKIFKRAWENVKDQQEIRDHAKLFFENTNWKGSHSLGTSHQNMLFVHGDLRSIRDAFLIWIINYLKKDDKRTN